MNLTLTGGIIRFKLLMLDGRLLETADRAGRSAPEPAQRPITRYELRYQTPHGVGQRFRYARQQLAGRFRVGPPDSMYKEQKPSMSISQLARSIKESPTLKLNEEAQSLRSRGEPVINMGIGEPKNKAPITAVSELGRQAQRRGRQIRRRRTAPPRSRRPSSATPKRTTAGWSPRRT